MLEEIVNTAYEQVVDGSTLNRVLQKLQEAYKDYINTITLLADAKGWEKEKLMQLKSEAQDRVRSAKTDLKKLEKENKGCAAQRRLDCKAATLSKLQQEAIVAQQEQNMDKLEELSTLMNEESKELGDQAEEMRLQAASSAFKVAKQAQCIRQLSKEDRGSIVSVASSTRRPKVQPQNLRFHDEAAPGARGTPTYGPAAAASNQCDEAAGDLPADYSGLGGGAAQGRAA